MYLSLKVLVLIFVKLQKYKSVHRFSALCMIADEATDTSNTQQLGLVLSYTIKINVAEQLYEYVDC